MGRITRHDITHPSARAGASVPAGGVTLKELRTIFESTLAKHELAPQLTSAYEWVRLYKLHGWISWETARILGSEVDYDVVQKREIGSGPLVIYLLLVKNLGHPIFAELFARFGRSLMTSERLVVVGSSLSDPHLRAQILFSGCNLTVSPCAGARERLRFEDVFRKEGGDHTVGDIHHVVYL